MNTDTKIFNELLANQIQEYIKKNHSPQLSGIFFQGSKVVQYSQINQPDILHNKMKDKNHMIISIDAKKKAFDKVQHAFMIKTLNKVGLEGIYLNIIKAINENPQITSYSLVKN